MMTIKHNCVPQTLSPEALGEWIMNQKIDVENHIEQIPLTEEEITEFEHASSLASRAIDRLLDVKQYFDNALKKGTPFDKATEQHKPLSVTIPPSKGLDALKANREYADEQITLGHKEEITALYLIPYPETSRMIMVNIVGVEWPEYSRDMTADEQAQYKPLLKRVAEAAPVEGENETIADTATVTEGKKKKNRSQRIEEQKAEDDKLFPDDEPIIVSGPAISGKDDNWELKSDLGASTKPKSDHPFE